MRYAVLTATVVTLLSAALASGQGFHGRIQGFVKDSSGAVMVGAKLQLVDTATGVTNNAETNTEGHYIFDFVNLGNYNVIAEAPGFAKAVQEHVTVDVSGDVTVNLTLAVGRSSQTVTVLGAPTAVKFNSPTLDVNITTSELAALPNQQRNPLTMSMLIPAGSLGPGLGVAAGQSQYPWYMWMSPSVGGTTSAGGGGMEYMMDGAPTRIANFGGFAPSSDAVQEVNVSQNSADAEEGFSQGGMIRLVTKSGTNQWHGSLTYENQNPYFEARSFKYGLPNPARKQIANASVGNPIIKNKLFVFNSYEQWLWSPSTNGVEATVPTAAEVKGDFSQALNKDGTPNIIYDPTTTVVNTATNTATRAPFLGNIVPPNRIDQTSALMMGLFNWGPNRTPDDLSGTNNFHANEPITYHYWNFVNRTDWNVSDKLRVYGHYGQLFQVTDALTYGRVAETNYYEGNQDHGKTISGGAIYTLAPNVVLDFTAQATYEDQLFPEGKGTLPYPQWSQNYLGSDWSAAYYTGAPGLQFPQVNIGEWGQSFGLSLGWLEGGWAWSFEPKVAIQKGRHYIKMGLDFRQQHINDGWPVAPHFSFAQTDTAATFINANLAESGNGYASFLLGGIDNGDAPYVPTVHPQDTEYALFFQDDLKLTPRITLNFGLRAEKDNGPLEANNKLMQYADPNGPLPALASAGIVMPSIVTQIDSQYGVPAPTWTGGAYFATPSNRHYFGTSVEWEPRAGLAYKINNNTSLRMAYSHWAAAPIETMGAAGIPVGVAVYSSNDSVTAYGYSADTVFQGFVAGKPISYLHNPAPSGLIPPTGNSLGVYTNLGADLFWNNQKYRPPQTDRINFTAQHQFPGRMLLEATYLFSYGTNIVSNAYDNYNIVNPQMGVTLGSQLATSVANPFYNILTPAQFPGNLRNYPTVALSQLVQPYPYYTSFQQMLKPGLHDKYDSVQVQLSRPLVNGLQVLASYAYDIDRVQQFVPNTMDLFNGTPEYSPSTSPHHRLNIATVAELPFGRGRHFANHLNRYADLFAGGWNFSAIYMIRSGDPLPLGDYQLTGIPMQVTHPSPKEWINPAAFELKSNPYALRTTPLYAPGVFGPHDFNLDCSFLKQFAIHERWKAELRFELYNATNTWIQQDPYTSILPTDPQFGTIPATADPRDLSRIVQTELKLVW